MLKQRGRVLANGSVDAEIIAEYEYPVYMKNKAGTAWVAQWVYLNGASPEYRVKSGVTRAAATPASGTDGQVLATRQGV